MTRNPLVREALEHALQLQEREIRELIPTAQADSQRFQFGITARKRLDRMVKYAEILSQLIENEAKR